MIFIAIRALVGGRYCPPQVISCMAETQSITPATRIERVPNFDIRFPPLPRTVTEVSRLVAEKPDVPDTPYLVSVVNADPVVAGSVLRRINSAYYGVRRRVGSIHKAVYLLGFDEVCDIVLTSGMMRLQDILNSKEQTRIFDQLMRMSVGTASFAKKIALHLKLHQQTSAFTLGLLHTSGRLVLLYNRPEDYEALWWTNDFGFAPTGTSEQIIFGTDHAELGSMAAESWLLPEFIVEVIRHYMTPGHLSDRDLRLLALTLSVSVTAMERLCLHELPSDTPYFEAPAGLHLLAKLAGTAPEAVKELIEANCREVYDYTHSMISSSD